MTYSKSQFRFVICVDVEEKDLASAYSKLYDAMAEISSPQLEWESTDEAYFEDGEEIDPKFLQKAREIKLNQIP
jgi:hypothetical protein